MFDYYLDLALSWGKAVFYGVTLGVGTLLLFFTGWLWWHYNYLNPQTVFWASFNNNLIINGVTKHTVSQDNSGKLDQYDQLNLGAHNLVKTVSTVTQQNRASKSVVVTETIGVPEANFSRYTKIDTDQKTAAGNPLNFGKVLNVWSKQDLTAGGNGTFADAVFDVIPFSHLNASQRQQVIHDAQQNETYKIDFGAVSKARKNGRLYYGYEAEVAPDKFVTLIKQVDALMGLNQLKNLDPSQYQGGNPIKVRISIDARAHQLESITYTGTARQESYSAWGAQIITDLPGNTVTQANLQSKLNAILNGQ